MKRACSETGSTSGPRVVMLAWGGTGREANQEHTCWPRVCDADDHEGWRAGALV